MKERFRAPPTRSRPALLAAKVQFDKGKADARARRSAWVVEHGVETSTGRSRGCALPAVLLDAEDVRRGAEAARSAPSAKAFDALVADRRGDILLAQGKKRRGEGRLQEGLDKRWTTSVDYRRLIEAKLTALGVDPTSGRSGAAAPEQP